MIALEEKQLQKITTIAEQLDTYVKLLLGVGLIWFVMNMFLTPEMIIKYISPLFSETTLMYLIGGVIVALLVRQMRNGNIWLIEAIARGSKGVVLVVLIGIPLVIIMGVILYLTGEYVLLDKSGVSSDRYIIDVAVEGFNKMYNITIQAFTTNLGNLGLLIVFLWNAFNLDERTYNESDEVEDPWYNTRPSIGPERGIINMDGEVDFIMGEF